MVCECVMNLLKYFCCCLWSKYKFSMIITCYRGVSDWQYDPLIWQWRGNPNSKIPPMYFLNFTSKVFRFFIVELFSFMVQPPNFRVLWVANYVSADGPLSSFLLTSVSSNVKKIEIIVLLSEIIWCGQCKTEDLFHKSTNGCLTITTLYIIPG